MMMTYMLKGDSSFPSLRTAIMGTLVHIDYAKGLGTRGGMRAEELLKKLVLEYPDCCVGARI